MSTKSCCKFVTSFCGQKKEKRRQTLASALTAGQKKKTAEEEEDVSEVEKSRDFLQLNFIQAMASARHRNGDPINSELGSFYLFIFTLFKSSFFSVM